MGRDNESWSTNSIDDSKKHFDKTKEMMIYFLNL